MSKVLHLISHPGLGGAQKIVKSILRSTSEHYVYSFRKAFIDEFIGLKEKAFYYNSMDFSKFNVRILLDLRCLIKRQDFKILHLHLDKALIYGYLLKTLFFPKIKLVFHEHGTISGSDIGTDGSYPTWYIPLLNFTRNKVDKYLVIANHIASLYTSLTIIPKSKIALIENFIDDQFFFRRATVHSDDSKDKFVIGFAGRLVDGKGWKEFIEASAIIIKQDDQVYFKIAGSGEGEEAVSNLIKELGLAGRMTCLGYVSDMQDFYRSLDCFVAPSHFEAVGLTVIEAQAMEIPVLASNITAFQEILHDGRDAMLFQVKNAQSLARAMATILHNTALRKMLTHQGLLNAKEYRFQRFIDSLSKIYSSL